MKIAIISSDLLISWWWQRELLELSINLIKKWNEVDIFSTQLNKEECHPDLIEKVTIYTPKLLKIKIKDFKIDDTILIKIYNYIYNIIIEYINNYIFLKLIKKYEKVKKYDIINYHDSTIFLSWYFLKKNNFWMMNDLPWILDMEVKWLLKLDSILSKLFYFYFKKKLIRRVKNINTIIVLDNINNALVKKYFWLNSIIIRSWLNQTKFFMKKDISFPKKKYLILSTWIFFKHRRYEDIVEAIYILINKKHIKNIELCIIWRKDTDIDYYNKILNLIKNKQLEKNITLKWKVTENELLNKYKKSDFFIFANSPQTWWLAVFEAILSWCATIITKWCWAHEVLKNHNTACIISPKNPKWIADEIEYLINNPKETQKIILNWQKYIKNNISWEKYTEWILNIFKKNLWK